MRILASNPDTIGDLVLRQPLYRALADAGHELTLIVRASAEPAVPLVAPGARTLVLPREVYAADVDERWAEFEPLAAAARAWAPDLLLVAPYQWTRFEERLADALRGLPGLTVAGMTGRLYPGDPYAGDPPPSTLRPDRVAEVDEDAPEAEKNARLADMLGCPVASVDPVIEPDEPALAEARRVLAARGLAAGGYYLACVTGTRHVPIKAWPADRWAEALRTWAERHDRRFLFVGLPAERDVVDQVIAGMGDAGANTAVWMEENGSVPTLAALASLAAGYVGHDTGPMHVAAAAGRPVLAVFGGGHKLRFAPRATPSVVLSVRVPCAGCGWACSFDEAHCVKALPVADVLRAADDLEAGRVTGREARLADPGAERLGHMTRFAAGLARDRLRSAATLQKRIEALSPERLDRLAAERDEQARQAGEMAHALAAGGDRLRQMELDLRRLGDESAGLVRQLAEREQSVADLRRAVEAANERTIVEAAARKQETDGLRSESAGLRADTDALRKQVEALTADLAAARKAAEPPPPPPAVVARVRKSWRERLIDLACGTRHYEPRSVPPPMPKIRLVTRVFEADRDEDVRRTVESVLAERYPHLEYLLAAADADRPVVRGYADRVAKVVPLGEQPFAGVADAFATTDADLVARLDVGQAYEPGALMRIGEYFRDHSLAMAATFGQTDATVREWRVPVGCPRLDVTSLRSDPGPLGAQVVFRRQACSLLGPLDPSKGWAADWDLAVRVARRFGIRRGAGDGVCTFARREPAEAARADYRAAASAFAQGFGLPGRVRIAALRAAGTAIAPLRQPARPAVWDMPGEWAGDGFGDPSAADPVRPVGPATLRAPDRLLFTAPDVTSGDWSLHRVYYDTTGDTAVTVPPVDQHAIDRLHTERARLARTAPADTAPGHSPYRRFVGGPRWPRWVGSVPSPYWRLARQRPGADTPAAQLVSLVGPHVAGDATTRALVVGCYDGSDLDELKRLTRWELAGLETNPAAAEAARAKGHRVEPCSAQDAFMCLPDGEVFDLIFVPAAFEHWADPPWVLRRLALLLTPTGRLVVRTPNLDSLLLERFGPTWWHWQLPYHRTLVGRRGLRLVARAADLKVEKLRTVTDAYAAAASVQLNEVGLAGVVPDGAAFGPDVSARGAKLAGWARLLWDRWGRGDEMWAVLRPL